MTTSSTITTRERLTGAVDYARNARTILLIAIDKIQFEERAAAPHLELAAAAAEILLNQLEQAIAKI